MQSRSPETSPSCQDRRQPVRRRNFAVSSCRSSGGTAFLEKGIADERYRNLSLRHESFVELLGGERRAHSRLARIPQLDYRVLAEVVSDRLSRPLGVSVDGSRRGIKGGLRGWIDPCANPCTRREKDVLGEVVDRVIECHPSGVHADVDTDSNCTEKLSLELVEIFSRRVEAVSVVRHRLAHQLFAVETPAFGSHRITPHCG